MTFKFVRCASRRAMNVGLSLSLGLSLAMAPMTAAAQTMQVQLQTDTNVRSMTHNLLISDTILPAGTVIEVPVDGFRNAGAYSYWKYDAEHRLEFVKGVHVISAPGYSEQDLAEVNSWSKDNSLFMAKTILGKSIVVKNADGSEKVTLHAPAPVYRNDGPVPAPAEPSAPDQPPIDPPLELHPPLPPSRDQIDKKTAENLVKKIQQGNRDAKKAGVNSNCVGCTEEFRQKWIDAGVPERALKQALDEQARNPRGLIHNTRFITIVDFTKRSNEKRMFVIDTKTGGIEKLYTSAGKNTENRPGQASRFSNSDGSKMTPAGFHVTGFDNGNGVHTTAGLHHSPTHGKTLLLIGLESKNSNSAPRRILIHSADYASESFVRANRRTGRSWGCLGIDPTKTREVLDKIQGGSLVYNYTGD